MGSAVPFRLDFFDDEIDSIRTFDVDTQRTLDEIQSINLLPAHEFPTDEKGIEFFRTQFRETFGEIQAEELTGRQGQGTVEGQDLRGGLRQSVSSDRRPRTARTRGGLHLHGAGEILVGIAVTASVVKVMRSTVVSPLCEKVM